MDDRYTDIRLVKVPLEIDNKNQLNFSSATTQYNYFNGCQYIELENSSYQRKDNTVRYPGHIDDLIGYNYCMYKNTSYNANKWFYAFITDMQYINDSMTLVSIKTDVWQTWQFDIELKKSFVEREHVNDDTVGKHTINEDLYLGELTNNSSDNASVGIAHAVIATSYDVISGHQTSKYYNGINSGLWYYVVGDHTSVSFIDWVTQNVNPEIKNSVVSIFMVPDSLTGYPSSSGSDYWSYAINEGGLSYAPYHLLNYSTSASLMETKNITKNTTIDTYTPKNNKLLVFPYNFLSVDNNGGSSYNYHYEYFSTTNCGFDIYGDVTPGCSIRLIPKSYKGISSNNSEGINCGKFPICSWSNDIYTNWLTQNGVNIPGTSITLNAKEAGITSGILQTILGAGSMIGGNPYGVGSAIGGIADIAGTLKQDYQMSLTPPQIEGNINSGDVTYSTGNLTFTFYKKSIRKEMAVIIDNFFSMFGYKVNEVKIPNITGRTNWNYVKTIDCNLHGYIPQKDCIEIKNMFNAGVTFWHNPSTFLDYSQSNTIVAS